MHHENEKKLSQQQEEEEAQLRFVEGLSMERKMMEKDEGLQRQIIQEEEEPEAFQIIVEDEEQTRKEAAVLNEKHQKEEEALINEEALARARMEEEEDSAFQEVDADASAALFEADSRAKEREAGEEASKAAEISTLELQEELSRDEVGGNEDGAYRTRVLLSFNAMKPVPKPQPFRFSATITSIVAKGKFMKKLRRKSDVEKLGSHTTAPVDDPPQSGRVNHKAPEERNSNKSKRYHGRSSPDSSALERFNLGREQRQGRVAIKLEESAAAAKTYAHLEILKLEDLESIARNANLISEEESEPKSTSSAPSWLKSGLLSSSSARLPAVVGPKPPSPSPSIAS